MKCLENLLRFKSIDKLLTIEDLKKSQVKLNNVSIKDKKDIRLLFIDDEGFDETGLNSIGYLDIKVMERFDKMSDIEPYDFIFCDINGIATNLDEKYQGAALAKQIKSTYPEKIVYIFSNKPQSVEISRYSEYVDGMIAKNLKSIELAEIIEKNILEANDPIKFWEENRDKLLKNGVPITSIAILEDCYVRSLLRGEDTTKCLYQELEKYDNLQPIVDIIKLIIKAIKLYLEGE